jgi:heme A synthase
VGVTSSDSVAKENARSNTFTQNSDVQLIHIVSAHLTFMGSVAFIASKDINETEAQFKTKTPAFEVFREWLNG